MITEYLNTGLKINHFSTNLANFTKKNKYFTKIDKRDCFKKLDNSGFKKIKNILKNISKNYSENFRDFN